jgi:hydroxymethylglutaryl-CoA lyase
MTKNDNNPSVKIIECPRDAMQGIKDFIPTKTKIAYLNQLLKVGFDTLDCGSFVSPKVIPQLKDTAEVLNNIDLTDTSTKLLTIVANIRGIEEAVNFENISYLGFPLSLSETFQQKNTNKSIDEAFSLIEQGSEYINSFNKEMVLYLSMGFGNPYGDPYSPEYIYTFVSRLEKIGIKIISLSDTIGIANPKQISELFEEVLSQFPSIEFGAHLHSTSETTEEKIAAAYNAGCIRFDTAINGYGGCPMADNKLVGNLSTQKLINYFKPKFATPHIKQQELDLATQQATAIFPLS